MRQVVVLLFAENGKGKQYKRDRELESQKQMTQISTLTTGRKRTFEHLVWTEGRQVVCGIETNNDSAADGGDNYASEDVEIVTDGEGDIDNLFFVEFCGGPG